MEMNNVRTVTRGEPVNDYGVHLTTTRSEKFTNSVFDPTNIPCRPQDLEFLTRLTTLASPVNHKEPCWRIVRSHMNGLPASPTSVT